MIRLWLFRKMKLTPDSVKQDARDFIAARETSEVPFPFAGLHRELVIALMGAFACDVVARELKEIVGEEA